MEKRKLLILTAVSMESHAVARALGLTLQPARNICRYCGPDLELYQIGVAGARLPPEWMQAGSAHPLAGVIEGEDQGGSYLSPGEDPHPTLPRSTGRGERGDALRDEPHPSGPLSRVLAGEGEGGGSDVSAEDPDPARPRNARRGGKGFGGRFCGIILAGLAGALDPSLAIGEVVVDSSPADAWGELPYRRGSIHTADAIVATPAEKAELFRRTGAVAVEMEGQCVRKLSNLLGLPLLSLRAISDIAHEALDPAVVGFMDEFGEPRPAAVVAAMVRRPRLIGSTLRLARNARRAADSLTAAIRFLGEKNLLRPMTGVRASHPDGGF